MLEMYKGIANSPETTITNDINNLDTIIYVLDETRIPELPNIMVLGNGISAETVKVLSIEGNTLTVERAFQGVARSWNAGTLIARNFSEYDYRALVENIEELDGKKTTSAVTDSKIIAHNTEDDTHQNIIGLLASLTTTQKANLVGAINELKAQYNDIATDMDTHKAEITTQLIVISRDVSIEGIQTIATLPRRRIQAIKVLGLVNGTKRVCLGTWMDGAQRGMYYNNDGLPYAATLAVTVPAVDTVANRTTGNIQNVTNNGFNIQWVKVEAGGVGTLMLNIEVYYHD